MVPQGDSTAGTDEGRAEDELSREASGTSAPTRWRWPQVLGAFGLGLLFGLAVHIVCAVGIGGTVRKALFQTHTLWWNIPILFLTVLVVVVLQWRWKRRTRNRAQIVSRRLGVLTWFIAGYALFLGYVGSIPFAEHGQILSAVPSSTWVEDDPNRPRIVYRYNSDGFRGPDWGPKEPGSLRGVVIGDSFAFGSGLEWEDTLGECAAQRVRDLYPNQPIEFLNLGLTGLNLVSGLDIYETLREELDPDLVILTLVGVNDLARNDTQGFLRRLRVFGPMSILTFVFVETRTIWDFYWDRLAHRDREGNLHVLNEQLRRLGALRAEAEDSFVVVGYNTQPNVSARLASDSSLLFVSPAMDPDPSKGDFIPNDGHPTGQLNRRIADEIVTRLERDSFFTPRVSGPN